MNDSIGPATGQETHKEIRPPAQTAVDLILALGDNSPMPPWIRQVEIPAERLDRWLHGQLPGYSMRRVRELIQSGKVKVEGRPARKGTLLRRGGLVTIK